MHIKNSATDLHMSVNGYSVTATFAEQENPVVLEKVRQILFSSYSDALIRRPGGRHDTGAAL